MVVEVDARWEGADQRGGRRHRGNFFDGRIDSVVNVILDKMEHGLIDGVLDPVVCVSRLIGGGLA